MPASARRAITLLFILPLGRASFRLAVLLLS
jgi:hypothetical protein